ncbi:MAG TPA: MG2 domain-containing protein, partial [Luteolibacter sp.]
MKTWLLIFVGIWMTGFAQAEDGVALRKERDALMTKGRWKEALDFYREKLSDQDDPEAHEDLGKAVECVRRLSAWAEFDALIEQAVEKHPNHSRVLGQAGDAYLSVPHGGRWIAGEFERTGWYGWGGWRGGRAGRGKGVRMDADGGEMIDASWRDRAQALRLLKRAVDCAADDPNRALAWNALRAGLGREVNDAWKLQTLTPLDKLPDWRDEGPEGGTEGAPWAGDGPVLYGVPVSWEAAKNDGERWRFAGSEQGRLDSQWKASAILDRARFSVRQFGSQTLMNGGWWSPPGTEEKKGVLQLETLAENETLAKTSSGVRRFPLPEDQHFIPLFRSVMGDAGVGGAAGDELAQAYLNRRQFDLARQVIEATLAKHGDTPSKTRAALLKQITGNWGRIGPVPTVAAGTKPVLPLEFRNATSVKFSAAPIHMEKVLDEVKEHLKSNPSEVNYQRIQPGSIGWRLVNENPGRYVGQAEATWTRELKPLPKHHDTRAEIPMPLDKAGAWWVRADLGDGNTIFTVVWIVDQVLVRREVAGKHQWWVADAVTGAPVEGANLDFFGYKFVDIERKLPIGRRQNVKTKEFSRQTDADGRTLVNKVDWDESYQWMAVSRKEGRAPAFIGFEHFYQPGIDVETGARDASYAVTDRPFYKAGDTVHAKFWLREVGYDGVNEGKFAGKTGRVVFTNGRGEEVIKFENQKADAFGGLEVQAVIPKDAVLGQWSVRFEIPGPYAAAANFRVEEYRKPEYEVTVEAPTEPVRLGDSFTAKVKATYFHGAPVRKAQVEITVKRGMVTEPWFPIGRWDWLYGRGTWWNAPEASWHPGWRVWGCIPPLPVWWTGNRWTPEEVVLKQMVDIGEDGTASVTIDTATAKAIHGDLDAKYSIEARVTDASRREETANGEVVAAREPFRVVVWLTRGFAKP